MPTKVTICIPHVDTPHYVIGCVNAIDRNAHPEIEHEIIVVDQSGIENKARVHDVLGGRSNVRVLNAPRIDAGYPIDVALRHATGEFFCSLDCDAFPVRRNWLAGPVRLVRDHGVDWVGVDTGLAQAYLAQEILPPYLHLNNYFRVSRTDIALATSEAVGFLRHENHHKASFTPKETAWPGMHCDNGVVAQWHSSQKGHRKATLSITAAMGVTLQMGLYGMLIEDSLLHLVFGYGEEWITDMRAVLGETYLQLRDRLLRKGVTEEILQEMVSQCKPHPGHPRMVYDGHSIAGEPMSSELQAVLDAP